MNLPSYLTEIEPIELSSQKPKAHVTVSCVTFFTSFFLLKKVVAALSGAFRDYSNDILPLYLIDNVPGGDLNLSLKFGDNWIKGLGLEVEFSSGHGNVGFGAGHNLALNEINSDFHLILNPDAFLDKNALSVGIKYLAEHPDVAMVVPQVFEESGETQYTAKRYPSLFILMLRGFSPCWVQRWFRKKLDHYELRDKIPATDPVDIDIASGCFMLARTSALKEVGGFDDSFFMYFEDFDLSLRLREKYRIVYLPDMKIIHLGGNAAKKGFKHIKYFCTSAFKFFNKHGWKWV